MAWSSVNQIAGNQAISARDATQNHEVGLIVQASEPDYGIGEFIYLKGAASMEIYDWCTYALDGGAASGAAVRLAANAIGPVCISQATITSSYWGWFQISGKAIGQALASYADNAQVWITATAGAIDDTSVAGDLVNNAKGASAVGAGTTVVTGAADFEIHRPWVDNISSAT